MTDFPARPGVEVTVDGEMLSRFVVSAAPVVVIQGPWGSGKSTAACLKLLLNAINQPRDRVSGKRRRRTYIVRSTYDELERTTLSTWLKVFPEAVWGPVLRKKPMLHEIRVGDLEWDVTFLALDREEDAAKLLSAEISDCWFNEVRESSRKLFKDAKDRTNRWPDAIGGCYRPQAIADTNPAPEDHWVSVMSGQCPMPDGLDEEARELLTRPESWEFLVQPPAMLERRDADGRVSGYAMNPKRENRAWTGDEYYLGIVEGASRAMVMERCLNRPGTYYAGDPVWPQYREEAHVAAAPLLPISGHPVLIGVDFGRTPAAVLGQAVFGRWFIQHELAAENMGAKEFARMLGRQMAVWYPDHELAAWGDPAGYELEQSDDISPFRIFWAEGIPIQRAPTNDPIIRTNAVDELLRQMVDGRPRLLLCPSGVPRLRAAMAGGYRYRKRGAYHSGPDRPEKNRHSHIADALQYLVIGAGEGAALLSRPRARSPLARPARPAAARRRTGWDLLNAWQR